MNICFITHDAMKTGGGSAELFFLLWAQSGGEWLVSNLSCFTLGEGASGACVVGSWWTPEMVRTLCTRGKSLVPAVN